MLIASSYLTAQNGAKRINKAVREKKGVLKEIALSFLNIATCGGVEIIRSFGPSETPASAPVEQVADRVEESSSFSIEIG